ncbi:rRNA methyltransferase 2, mitochondrial [Pseudolycoriella hygida]|uniref:rRNA methyltransferase 2, mitochondrial n=1 Tax=Pseudolycoriella hygida TaxID=35572 RepID=A0A9Q0MXE7_9DIPT|nr:rRNA methyltransferase 2, mitochondrial [Pseudolycoriella hygida]
MNTLKTLTRNFHSCGHECAKVVPKNLKGRGKSSQEWLTRQLSDPFVEKAKMMNYRCRSAFKLVEINEKHGILKPGFTVIDCGASPGSWCQVAAAETNSNKAQETKPVGLVIGIDLLQIYPIPGVHLLGNADFMKDETQQNVKSILCERKVDCVLSDMAPNATGIRNLDQENITKLSYSVLRFAVLTSSVDASLLVKLWNNGDVPQLEKDMLRFYKTVKMIKPVASRSESAEVFMLAKGFLGLKS